MAKLPNTNLLLGVGGIIAAVFLISQLRKAGGDLQSAIAGIQLPSIGDINFPEIKFPDFNFPSIFGSDDSSSIAGKTIIQDDKSTIFIPESTVIDPQTGIVTSDTPSLLDLSDAARDAALAAREIAREKQAAELALAAIPESENISGAEFASAINDAEFRARQEVQEEILRSPNIVSEPIVSELPTEQLFGSGGVSFIGGTIRENPIDTLKEVLDLFPKLSASQAADFLDSFSGISPSDALLVDPDIKNITANIAGENIQIPNVTISDLDAQEKISACLTCDSFGLNCDICNEGLA